jgi:predicted transcriptional regulator YdeE
MTVPVVVHTVHSRQLAAVAREAAPQEVASVWGPGLDKVWALIRSRPGLRAGGHNIFVYHRAEEPGGPLLCEFGVEVTAPFEAVGEVYATETPEGEAAVTVHRGPYERMNEAYLAIEEWMASNHREPAGHSWEIYGDPAPDSGKTETTIVCLLKARS